MVLKRNVGTTLVTAQHSNFTVLGILSTETVVNLFTDILHIADIIALDLIQYGLLNLVHVFGFGNDDLKACFAFVITLLRIRIETELGKLSRFELLLKVCTDGIHVIDHKQTKVHEVGVLAG